MGNLLMWTERKKDLQGTFIFAVCLLAFTVVVLIFKYGQERAQSQILKAENLATQNMALSVEMEAARKAQEADRLSRIAQQSAQKNLENARQAREMLERAKKQNSLGQKELIDKLNAQLEREADARLSAQKASEELSKQRDELRKAVESTKEALEKLRAQKPADDSASRIAQMQQLLREREAEIERLKKRQAELEFLRKQAYEAQRRTEMEIAARSGTVSVPRAKLILSPNIRTGGKY